MMMMDNVTDTKSETNVYSRSFQVSQLLPPLFEIAHTEFAGSFCQLHTISQQTQLTAEKCK